ncbi:MAG TPA: CHAT domain-containing protein, partial [Thermoanaerobaculia bacterium]
DGVNAYDSGLVVEHRLAEGLDPEVFVPESRWLLPTRRLTVAGVLAKMDLRRCGLVTLSACCTGLPHLHPASEFTSLPAAFLVAGARNVIGSLWPAHDGATALLMEHLYAALDKGMGPAEALRGSRRWLAGMTREEALQRLGPRALLAPGSHPFESPMFTMAFQAYGVD